MMQWLIKLQKKLAAASAVLHGKIDAIILTGGLAYGKDFVKIITRKN